MNKRNRKLAWGQLAALVIFVALGFVTPESYVWVPCMFIVLTFYLLCDHLGSSMRFFPKGTFKSCVKPQRTANPSREPLFPTGTTGITKTKMMPLGRIQIGNQVLDALSISGALDTGIEVEVVGQELNQPKVRKLEVDERVNASPATE